MGDSHVMTEPLDQIRLNAAKCRELADTAITPAGREVLLDLADKYQQLAGLVGLSERRQRCRPAFQWPLDHVSPRQGRS